MVIEQIKKEGESKAESCQPDSNKELDQFPHHTSCQNSVTAVFFIFIENMQPDNNFQSDLSWRDRQLLSLLTN